MKTEKVPSHCQFQLIVPPNYASCDTFFYLIKPCACASVGVMHTLHNYLINNTIIVTNLRGPACIIATSRGLLFTVSHPLHSFALFYWRRDAIHSDLNNDFTFGGNTMSVGIGIERSSLISDCVLRDIGTSRYHFKQLVFFLIV